jgi:large subunit ribosomal protein L2
MSLLIKSPVTPSLRKTILVTSNLKKNPIRLKNLVIKKTKTTGRNNQGQITMYTKGGGHKRLYRIVDLNKKETITGVVYSIEYSPTRSASIAKIYTITSGFKYIIACTALKRGHYIQDFSKYEHLKYHSGCLYLLSQLSVGTYIYNVNFPNSEKNFAISAGCAAKILTLSLFFCRIKLPSGEIRLVKTTNKVYLGRVSNVEHRFTVIGKAGRNRWLNKRPKVRGVAMNPVDHPHGGGQGKTSGGRPSVTPWGKVAKGQPTRKKKYSSKFIIKQ